MSLTGSALVSARSLRGVLRRRLHGTRGSLRSGSSSRFRATGLARQVTAFLVVPGRFVVSLSRGVEAGVQAVLGKLEAFFDDEGGVGEVDQIVFGDAVVLDRVVDYPTEKGYVRPGADLNKQVGVCRGTREPR